MSKNKWRPILFNSWSVCRILDGEKTQTRRAIRDKSLDVVDRWVKQDMWWGYIGPTVAARPKCPYGKPGDFLWVRETHQFVDTWPHELILMKADNRMMNRATNKMMDNTLGVPARWRPSIHMPRWASRISLRVLSVLVERVQDISEMDARAEGCDFDDEMVPPDGFNEEDRPFARNEFQYLWDSINAKRGFGWSANPRVWVVKFELLDVRGGQ